MNERIHIKKEKTKSLENLPTNNFIKNKIIAIVIVLILSYFLSLLCFSNPFSKVGMATDSSVFTYIAKRINKGELPYRDYFDHKGPILYCINWISVNFCGIWLIEYLTIFITVLLTQKILKKVFEFKDLEANVLNLMINSNLVFFLQGGNYTELYALPMITFALYLMLTVTKKNKKSHHFLIGMLMGLVFGLRANMIGVWLAYYLMVTINCLKKKKAKEFLSIFIYSSLGFLCVIGILVIFLEKLGILKECIDCYLVFNLKYAVHSQKDLLSVVKHFALSSNITIYFMILLSFWIAPQKFRLFSILFMFFSFVIVLQPRNKYLHYGLILVPTFIIPIANIYTWLKEKQKNQNLKNSIMIVYLLAILICPLFQYVIHFIYINQLEEIEVGKMAVAQYIKTNSSAKDKILVLGNDCEIYLLTNRVAASKYLYQTPIYKIDANVKEQLIKDIEENKPHFIIIGERQIHELINGKEELEEDIVNKIKNDYSLCEESYHNFKIYQRKLEI